MNYNFLKTIFNNKKVLFFFTMVSLLPFLSGCETITIGFPTVAMEPDFSNFSIIGFLLNILFIGIFSILFIKFHESKLYKKSFNCGIFFVLLYHFFWILIHLDIFNFDIEVWAWIMVPLLFVLDFNFEVPYLWPDGFDLAIRISYLVSILFYFTFSSVICKIYLFLKNKIF